MTARRRVLRSHSVARVEFRILGPLEVADGDRLISVGSGRQRKLLAVLLVRANEVVSTDRLIHDLWGDSPPESAPKALQGYVSQLRRLLGRELLVTEPPGYALRVPAERVDAAQFERIVAEARSAKPAARTERLRSALTLWRGAALAEFADEDFARAEAGRLEELRLAAAEARIDADLELWRHAEVVGELEALVAQNPLRERPRAMLMVALYRSGRQTEALDVYGDYRRTLVTELGLEPGQELKDLHQAILSQAPSLGQPGSRARAPVVRRRRALFVGALCGVVAAAVAVPILARGGSEGSAKVGETVLPNRVAVIDPASNAVVEQFPVGARPGAIATHGNAVWVANLDDQSLSRLDAETGDLVKTIPLPAAPTALAAEARAVWLASGSASGSGSLVRVDGEFNSAGFARPIPEPDLWPDVTPAATVAFGDLWVVHSAGLLLRLDPTGQHVIARIELGNYPTAVAASSDAVWVSNSDDGTVKRIDPTNVVTATTPVGHGPSAIAAGADAVWVADSLDGMLTALEPETGAVLKTIAVGGRPVGLAVTPDAVWVIDAERNLVLRVDPSRSRVIEKVPLGNMPQGIAVVRGKPWVTVARGGSREPSGRGVARVDLRNDIGGADPAVVADPTAFQIVYATCAPLVGYPDRPAPEGSQLVPEVAESVPTPSAGGRVYTFRVRPGFAFSPPSNQAVTARTFKYAIERALDPRLHSVSAAQTLSDVVGETAFTAGKAPHIAGISAHGDTLTVRLLQPQPDFLARLAEPAFCPVPTNTPVDPKGVVAPAAGPYYVAVYDPGKHIIVKRNPNYHGSRPHRLAEFDFVIGVAPDTSVQQIERGRADYVADGLSQKANEALAKRFGPGSAAARAGRQQYFVDRFLSIRRLSLNTTRPPFSDPKLRRAVNYAIDRPALVAVRVHYQPGVTPPPGSVADAYLPVGVPGYPTTHVYPVHGPDLAAARKLVGHRRYRAVLYTCDVPPCPQSAEILTTDLQRVGIDLEVKQFSLGEMYQRISRPGEPFDIATTGWGFDYPDPGDLLGNSNDLAFGYSYLHDPAIDRRIAAASRLSPPARYRAFAAIVLDLERRDAPWAVIENDTHRDFFSRRMGCQVYQPVYGMDLAALCLRR